MGCPAREIRDIAARTPASALRRRSLAVAVLLSALLAGGPWHSVAAADTPAPQDTEALEDLFRGATLIKEGVLCRGDRAVLAWGGITWRYDPMLANPRLPSDLPPDPVQLVVLSPRSGWVEAYRGPTRIGYLEDSRQHLISEGPQGARVDLIRRRFAAEHPAELTYRSDPLGPARVYSLACHETKASGEAD